MRAPLKVTYEGKQGTREPAGGSTCRGYRWECRRRVHPIRFRRSACLGRSDLHGSWGRILHRVPLKHDWSGDGDERSSRRSKGSKGRSG